MFIIVYIISKDNKPLMPCKNVIARLLLKQHKAKVKRNCPFTIKLLYGTTKYTQECTLGIDTGSSHIGSAVVDKYNNVIYLADIIVRNDITDKMIQRRNYRRNRRNRKTRYRKPRWLNRANSIKKNRFSPTMTSKINSHIREINYVNSILPITKLIFETGTFDSHLMKNPNMNKHWGYQRGTNYGFANTKAKVLNRDKYICQYCKGKKKDSKLEIHHIIFRSNHGSDDEDNLITLCHTCHYSLHHNKIKLNTEGKIKGALKYATQMNSIRIQLLKLYPEAIETFGFITKENRQRNGLSKEHYNDAVMIASGGDEVIFTINTILCKKDISEGDYQQTKGARSEKRIPTGKIQGFRKFDKVVYLGNTYFIKGRMSVGYAVLMDVKGTKSDFSKLPRGYRLPKLSRCLRVSARKSQLVACTHI